jgi:hypothetical protein
MIILVDGDGGVHNITNNTIMSKKIQENDLKRPYQCDGMNAYVIQCYNDDLYSNDTIVLSLYDNTIMSIREFMSMIVIWNEG